MKTKQNRMFESLNAWGGAVSAGYLSSVRIASGPTSAVLR